MLSADKKSKALIRKTWCQLSTGALILATIMSLFISPTVFLSSVAVANANHAIQITKDITSQTQFLYNENSLFLPIIQKAVHGYYVSPNGNDANSGSFSRPWKTLGKAASTVEPGDTVFIRSGIYNEYVSFRTSGTESQPIRIIAYTGENPIIDGLYGDPGAYAGLLVIRGDYIYISGLEVRNSSLMGVYVYGNYNVVDNMYVHHCKENGIIINHGHDSIVQNSRIWRNVLSNEYGNQGFWSTGLSAARNGVQNAIIRKNIVWENWGEGISSFEADHVTIEDNIVHDNYGSNVYISDSTNVTCQQNFVYTDPASYVFPYSDHDGITMGDELYDPPTSNVVIINNISAGNQGNFWWWPGVQGGGMNNVLIANNTFVNGIGNPSNGRGNVIISEGAHQNVRFENNLILQDGVLPVIATVRQPGITYSNNLWSKTPPPAASGPGDIIADPLLAQTGNQFSPEWYKLTGISPAIGGALPVPEVTIDFFGINREAPPDMGANEFFPLP
jgi:hypothetical protein